MIDADNPLISFSLSKWLVCKNNLNVVNADCIRVWLIKEQILVFCFLYLCYIISHRIYEALDAI